MVSSYRVLLLFSLLFLQVQAQTNPLLSNRENTARKVALVKYGGVKGYSALLKGYKWLSSQQNPDGSWGKSEKTAMTSLVVLSFLTHAEAPTSVKFGPLVSKAIEWLISQPIDIDKNNGYPHAIKTCAIAEAYAITKREHLKDILSEHVSVIIKGQQSNGCYNYKYQTSLVRSDLSFASWNFQALRAAYMAGDESEKLPKTIVNCFKYLNYNTTGKNQFPYEVKSGSFFKGQSTHSMRAAGSYCLSMFNSADNANIADELNTIISKDLSNLNWSAAPDNSLYGWYYASLIMFAKGDYHWKMWNAKIQKMLIENQNELGYWDYPGKHESTLDKETERIFATSLCALILSTPFRYHPKAPLTGGKKAEVKDPVVAKKDAAVAKRQAQEMAHKEKLEKWPIVTVYGALKGTDGKVSIVNRQSGSPQLITFGKVKSGLSIIIEPEDRKALSTFRSFYKKNWMRKNTSGYSDKKYRLCFIVSGREYSTNGRTFIYPTTDIKFYRSYSTLETIPAREYTSVSYYETILKLKPINPPLD